MHEYKKQTHATLMLPGLTQTKFLILSFKSHNSLDWLTSGNSPVEHSHLLYTLY